ncbi:MAG: hypothetical protein M1820_001899 [Bogoriella megaspora]|nr:MAG: hypothetical protein M1820_001899 [Bogoriella megaspora]
MSSLTTTSTNQPLTTEPPPQFPYFPHFLDLPLEIRLQIYRLLLTSPLLPKLARLSTLRYCSDYVLPPLPITPSLLLVSRQLNHETTPILYRENLFAAHPSLLTSLPYLVTSSRPIRHTNVAKRIRRWWLHVRLDTDARYTAEEVEAAFNGCEELRVDVWQAQYASCGYEVLERFEGVRGVRRARVEGSVERGFGEWLEGRMMMPMGWEVGKEGRKPGTGEYDLWTHGGR